MVLGASKVGGLLVYLFIKFNRKGIDDRKIDTLVGMSKGLVAEGKVDQSEAEFILSRFIQARQNTEIR